MSEKPDTPKQDWRDTVFLPKTDFPMKAGLAQKEPAILARWAESDLYGQIRRARAGAERFILHDGPPYANGDIHIGHAMMKTIKDFILRSQSLMGKDAPFIPGWDCHGLPIEWKIEEQYRKKKQDKDEVPPREFRAECRAYAEHWVQVQSQQFQRLGITGDWADPYRTMDFASEAVIAGELLKFAMAGKLYRGAKPVMWSPVEKTALAEAEVEYEDIISTQIDVAFEIVESPIPELVGAYAVVWTTTPWTIPVNQAIAYGPDVEYILHHCSDWEHPDVVGRPYMEGHVPNRRYLIAAELDYEFRSRTFGGQYSENSRIIKGSELAGTVARHPMHHLGGFFARPRPFLPGDFVTTDAGTGLVHMAPDHGEDDFLLCKAHGLEPVFAVEADGKYRADWAWLGGQGSVINLKFNAPDGPINSDLREAGALLSASADFKHSYPHSWRSKAKVIFRATPQWFIPMDSAGPPPPPPSAAVPLPVPGRNDETALPNPPRNGEGDQPQAGGGGPTLRETALQAIEDTRWVPEKSKNRIRAMVEGRPDWVISRQRAWGVPIALYVHRKTGEYLKDEGVNARILAAFEAGGADAWFGADHQALLGNDYSLADYEPVNDILDVWFDSGSTHAFVVEKRYGEGVRADLYCEGSDQHRGWFQSSLLESCGTRGVAPYKAVLTHGFTLDQTGRKMSKSVGNVIDPLKIIQESGADILRLWVGSTDYFEDVRIGKEILAGTSDAYRKLRNTFRYLLGALSDFSEDERVAPAQMPELERWVLHRLAEIDAELREAAEGFDFNRYTRLLTTFANDDLSAFFFDIRKDSLYCDAQTDPKRRAYRTVLDAVFQALVRWLAPIIPFTTEEVWLTRYPEAQSVHLETWPTIPEVPTDSSLLETWTAVRSIRGDINAELEKLRRSKAIGSSLEAKVVIYRPGGRPSRFADVSLEEALIVSEVYWLDEIAPPDACRFTLFGEALETSGFRVTVIENEKCGRCWRHLPEVKEDGALCARCDEVVNG